MTRRKSDAARRELERRERARRTFREELSGYGPIPRHLDALVDALDAGHRRVACSMGPGFGKSTSLLRWLAQRLEKEPRTRVLFASYSGKLARHHVRELRALLQERGVRLDRDGTSTSMLRTEAGGYVAATSIAGGTGTGLRADIIVIDDICASRLEAESHAHRERAERWYKSVARTRLEPGTGQIVFITTRWRRDDLVGSVLDGPTGHEWHRIVVPVVDEQGESAWPERFSTAELHAIREEVGERDWWSLYMGAPLDDAGQTFRGVVLTKEPPPPQALVSLGVDVAYSARTSSDWTVPSAIAYDPMTRRAWIIGIEWHRGTLDVVCPLLASFSRRYSASTFTWATSGTEALAILPVLHERSIPVRGVPAIADKVSRAARFSGAWNEGRVLVPERSPFAERLVKELHAFPGGRFDDAIDSLASAYDAVAGGIMASDVPVAIGAGRVAAARGWWC